MKWIIIVLEVVILLTLLYRINSCECSIKKMAKNKEAVDQLYEAVSKLAQDQAEMSNISSENWALMNEIFFKEEVKKDGD